jgi:hypothetical protein
MSKLNVRAMPVAARVTATRPIRGETDHWEQRCDRSPLPSEIYAPSLSSSDPHSFKVLLQGIASSTLQSVLSFIEGNGCAANSVDVELRCATEFIKDGLPRVDLGGVIHPAEGHREFHIHMDVVLDPLPREERVALIVHLSFHQTYVLSLLNAHVSFDVN